MANKKAVLKQLADYFASKGQIMSPAQYKTAVDAPIRYIVAKRPFGSWSRMQQMMQVTFPFPEQWEKANKVAPTVTPKVAAPKKVAKAKVAPKKAKK